MNIIQLQHDPRLGYPALKDLPPLSHLIPDKLEAATVITFRDSGNHQPTVILKHLTGCSRFLSFPKGDLVFCGIESDSSLAPLILWDAAHQLPVGASIRLVEDYLQLAYLERGYFQSAFSVEKKDNHQIVFRKTAPLLAEQDAGLDRWSFCIPTGPGDATGLNVVVKRILELAIPEKEILLCGRPDKNFLYWEHVRIVGEDIPAPPVWITRKKNVLAKEARYENLCILHDRVFLPLNFLEAIKNFGDYFPFAAFQSLWFDDLLNLSPVRYSDYGCASDRNSVGIVTADKNNQTSHFAPSLFSEIEKQDFKSGNPLRNQPGSYLTGSLYIVKRHVWLHTPQNEALYWAEFEDIEQAKRCEANGIPHRIIPGGFTQSLFARPILYPAGFSCYFSANGLSCRTRLSIPLPTSKLKPLIKLSEADANKRLAKFIAKYCHEGNARFANESNTLQKIISAVYSAELPFNETAINTFVNDIERDVLCDQMGYGSKQWLVDQFNAHHSRAKINFSRHFSELIFQFAQRPRGRRFYSRLSDYFPKRSWMIKLGSWISAWRLAKMNGNFLYHPGGLRGYYHAILSSTPFNDYLEKKS